MCFWCLNSVIFVAKIIQIYFKIWSLCVCLACILEPDKFHTQIDHR